MAALSDAARAIRNENLALKQQGRRKCGSCKRIYVHSPLFFQQRGGRLDPLCKTCRHYQDGARHRDRLKNDPAYRARRRAAASRYWKRVMRDQDTHLQRLELMRRWRRKQARRDPNYYRLKWQAEKLRKFTRAHRELRQNGVHS